MFGCFSSLSADPFGFIMVLLSCNAFKNYV